MFGVELQRVHELIGRNVEQRFVAEEQVKHHPGCCRAQHNGAEYGSVEVAHDFFERKQDARDGRVERRCHGRRGPDGDQRFHFLRAQAEAATQHRREAGAYLHGWAFAAECYAAGERNRAAREFSQHCA